MIKRLITQGLEYTPDKRKASSSNLLKPNHSLNSSVVEHWIENPCVGGSIPPLDKSN
jgi:hypothetical protein